MGNHEYSLTRDPMDTLLALGKTPKAFLDERFLRCWEKAKSMIKEAA
jgi:hypothetical protein